MAPTNVRICYSGLMPLLARPWRLESQIRKRFPEDQYPELQVATATKLTSEETKALAARGGLLVTVNGQSVQPHMNLHGNVDASETLSDILTAIKEQLEVRRTAVYIMDPRKAHIKSDVSRSEESSAGSPLCTVFE